MATRFIEPSIFPGEITCVYSTKVYGQLAPFREDKDQLNDALLEKTTLHKNFFLKEIGINQADLVEVKQFHTDKVIKVGQTNVGRGFVDTADAMITSEQGVALSVVTSDCLPIFLYDPNKKVIAVVHAGWRGVYVKIIIKTIKKMKDDCEVNPADLLVWIGPHVSGTSYCFDIERYDDSPANTYFDSLGGVIKNAKQFCVDLACIAQKQMESEAVLTRNIEVSDLDTKTDKDFFSYQAGDRTNNVCVIQMKHE